MDDIFASSGPPSPSHGTASTSALDDSVHSDIPRLRSQHSTAGYREGITVAKADSVQAGFDEGYPLGALFGLRVGYILGVLEGLKNASSLPADQARIDGLIARAKQELQTEDFVEDRLWEQESPWAFANERRGGDEHVNGDTAQVNPSNLVDKHPLILLWMGFVKREAHNYGLVLQKPAYQKDLKENI